MATIIGELEAIAGQCLTSAEFTKRAKSYIKNVKGITQPLMSDCQLRDIFRKVDGRRMLKAAWEKYNTTIKPALNKRPECKGIWYEAWIDLAESWPDKWFECFRFMGDKEIIEACVKFLNERERFYDSPDYIDSLDSMIKDIIE